MNSAATRAVETSTMISALSPQRAPARSVDPVLARDVRAGLTGTPRRLPSYVALDARGLELTERQAKQPEFHAARDESALLALCSDELVAAASAGSDRGIELIDVTAAAGASTQRVIEAAVRAQGLTRVVPGSVDRRALEGALEGGRRPVALLLGSSLEAREPVDAKAMLASLRTKVGGDGRIIVSTRLRGDRDARALESEHDDALGLGAARSRNALERINRELDATFVPQQFAHRPRFDEAALRVELYLESARAQRVWLNALGLAVSFRAGERVCIGTQTVFTLASLDALVEAAGLCRVHTETNSAGTYGVHVLAAR